jgi:hypothetical protein
VKNKVKKRIIVWIFFGMLLTALPILGGAAMSLPKNPTLVEFFELACNQDLLAVAFTLSAAAAADVMFSREHRDDDIMKVFLGSIGMFMAFVSALSFAIIRSGDVSFEPIQVACGVLALYIGCMVTALCCEALSEE